MARSHTQDLKDFTTDTLYENWRREAVCEGRCILTGSIVLLLYAAFAFLKSYLTDAQLARNPNLTAVPAVVNVHEKEAEFEKMKRDLEEKQR